ncbi:MAG: peptidase P60 [Ponticaulis sp.]|nr:peptidase P60 [Ponticaulis sp.]
MTCRSQLISSGRDWIGTPYRHQASVKGVGADCLGLIRGIWRDCLGAEPELPPPYTPDWAEAVGDDLLLDRFQSYFVERPIGDAEPGDVLLFRMGLGCPAKHAALMTGPTHILHAYWGRSVCETRLVPWWQRRIAAAFAFPDI